MEKISKGKIIIVGIVFGLLLAGSFAVGLATGVYGTSTFVEQNLEEFCNAPDKLKSTDTIQSDVVKYKPEE